MNKHKFLFCLLACLSLQQLSFAQKNNLFEGKDITLYNYSFALDDEFQLHIQDLLENDPNNDYWTTEDPVVDMFTYKAYAQIETGLEEVLSTNILPKETLEGKVLYQVNGFPTGGKKKATASSSSPLYLKIGVQMTARDMITDELDVNEVGYKRKKIKAHVLINATLLDENGKTVFKLKGKAKGDHWIVLDRVAFFGFITIDGQDIVDEQDTLMSVLDEALEDLKQQLH